MERYFSYIDAAFKIVLAGAAAWSAYLFGYQRQQNDDVKLVTEMISDDKAQKRLIGIGLATAFIKDKRIPEEVFAQILIQVRDSGAVPVEARSATDKPSATPRRIQEAATVALNLAAANNSLIQSQVERADSNLPVRIYFHVSNPLDKDPANALGDKVERATVDVGLNRDINVPDTEVRPEYVGKTELRCFRAAECRDVAPKVINLLRAQGASALSEEPVDLSRRYENSPKLRPMHFEVWFAAGGVPK